MASSVFLSQGGSIELAAGNSIWWGFWVGGDTFGVVVPHSLHAAHEHKLQYTDHYVQRFADRTEYWIRITNLGSETAHLGLRWIQVV